MLKRISCDKFMCDGVVRKPIEFTMGLNVVLGAHGGKNSIGKSTLLMIIDFCFGGDDYVHKEKDTILKVGDHTIKFEFEFNGVSKYFKRSTDSHTKIEICDSNYKNINIITNDLFKDTLLSYYNIKNNDLSLRHWVSPFFRIYNRKNYNEGKPLNADIRQAENEGIKNILKMFNEFSGLSVNIELLEKYRKEKSYFDYMKSKEISQICKDKTQWELFTDDLKGYKKDLNKLLKDNDSNSYDPTINMAAKKKDLIKAKNKLDREISKQQAQLSDLDENEEYNESKDTKTFKSLMEFFPNVNIDKIKEIEVFRRDVIKYVKDDSKQIDNDAREMIEFYQKEIDKIDMELENYKDTPTYSDMFIKQMKEINEKITTTETAINNYNKYVNCLTKYKKAETALNLSTTAKTDNVAKILNEEMDTLNSLIKFKNNEVKISPILTFNELKSYGFYSPNDNGTGTRFKNLCLLDLAILRTTLLPAFAHDSIIFTNIEDEVARQLFQLYANEKKKQIFVSAENPQRYDVINDEGEIFNIAKEYTKIELNVDTKALFGEQWNKKE